MSLVNQLTESDIERYLKFSINEVTKPDIEITRQFRNYCASHSKHTEIFISRNIVLSTFQKLKQYSFARIESKLDCLDYTQHEYVSLDKTAAVEDIQNQYITVSCQFLCNFATCNHENCEYLFSSSIGESKFQDAVAAAVFTKNRKTLATILHMIYQCLNGTKSDSQLSSSRLIDRFLSWRSLCCQILLDVTNAKLTTSNSSQSQSQPITNTHANQMIEMSSSTATATDEAMEWLYLLVKLVIDSDLNSYSAYAAFSDSVKNDPILILFNLVGPSSSSSSFTTCKNSMESLTHEQVLVGLLLFLYPSRKRVMTNKCDCYY